MSQIDSRLLAGLRIEGEHRETARDGVPRWIWAALGVLIAVAVAAAIAWWVLARPLTVQTATATAPTAGGAAGAVLQATGYITARRQATVSTQITGTLTDVLIEEGVHVERGQVIARLESTGLRASLNAAEANAMAAQAQAATAQAQLAQVEADLRRQETLVSQGMVTKQTAEQARTAVLTATAQLDARRRDVDVAKAQVALAKVNFDYAVVRAPFSGIVTVKAAQVGEIVSPLSAGGGFTRTGVGTIVDMDSLEIDVDVSEAYIGQIAPAMPAEAVLGAYPDWKIPAHVIAIIPAADRGKATVKVRVGLDQKDARIVPDMGVRVSFLAAKSDAAAAPPKGVLVPPQAIVTRGDRRVLYVVDGGRAVERAVPASTVSIGDLTLVPDGVRAGDRVVLAPPPTLQDGASVAIETH